MFERLAIVGTGAIGSVIGGYLSRAGREVTLIDTWADHVEAMRKKGLTITAEDKEFNTPVRVLHLGEANTIQEPFDAIFLAVKSYDTVWATHFAMNYLKPSGVIISAQNGINDETIAPIVGFSRDIACVITLGAGLYEPGHALHTGDPKKLCFTLGELSGVATNRVKELAEVMNDIGPTKVSANIWGERWAKLAVNSMANPIAASTGLGSAAVRQTPGVVDVSINIASEVVRVGTALGVQVEPISGIPASEYLNTNDAEAMEDLKTRLAEGAKQLGEGRPSMLQDVVKGRRTEIEYLNGYVARRGDQMGIDMPFCDSIVQVVTRVQRGEIKPGPANIEPLKAKV
jgi:2-dehydropantoate 2-reductase